MVNEKDNWIGHDFKIDSCIISSGNRRLKSIWTLDTIQDFSSLEEIELSEKCLREIEEILLSENNNEEEEW